MDIQIDTSKFNALLDQAVRAGNKDAVETVEYNSKMVLKKVAYSTKKAEKSDVPKSRKGRIGRMRAGWYEAWQALGIAGKAYSTAGAVKMFKNEGDVKVDKTFPNISTEMINNCPYIDAYPEIKQDAENAMKKLETGMEKYIARKLGYNMKDL